MTLDIDLTDMFCGAGGSTTGAVQAGVNVKYAINHWDRAIETHNTNYPKVEHILTDLHVVSPRKYKKTTGLIASPECTNHSLAKGRRKSQQGTAIPGLEYQMTADDVSAERSRCTMWTPLEWAECHRYQFVILENVVDIGRWEPFEAWLHAWRSLGYDFELTPINSMHIHPTPQSRDRLYFVAWRKGNPKPDLKITPLAYCVRCEQDVNSLRAWKRPEAWTNYRLQCGKYRQQYVFVCPHCNKDVTPYYYAAINAIDWSLPAPRIGDRKKPLAEKTMERIAYGLQKFVHDPSRSTSSTLSTAANSQHHELTVSPFLINLTHTTVRPIEVSGQPFPTQTTYDVNGFVVPPFILDHLGEYRPRALTGAFSTICAAGNHHSLVVPPALLLQTSHSECDHASYVFSSHEGKALPTQTTRQELALAVPPLQGWLMTYYNNGQMVPVSQAVPTVTTLERHALVTGMDAIPDVADCGFRMLTPSEIQAAMAFPSDYILTGTHKEQVEMLGNAVTPPVMKLLMERVVASLAA